MDLGYALSSEEHASLDLVRDARRAEESLDRDRRLHLPPVELVEHLIKRLQGARHLQIGELETDAIAE